MEEFCYKAEDNEYKGSHTLGSGKIETVTHFLEIQRVTGIYPHAALQRPTLLPYGCHTLDSVLHCTGHNVTPALGAWGAHSTLTDPRGPLLAPLPFHPFSCPGLPAAHCDGFEEAPPRLCSVAEPRHWLLIIYCALLHTGPFLHMPGWPTTTELPLLISIVFNLRYGPPTLLKMVLTTVLQPQSPEYLGLLLNLKHAS